MLKSMAQQEFDLPEAASLLWKLGAAIALIVGLGALVRGRDPRLSVSTSQRRYVRDSLSGAVAVPVRMAAERGNVWLHGCPRPPVVFLQRQVDGLWVDEPRVNHFCSGDEKKREPIRIASGRTATTLVMVRAPGMFHVAVPVGINWTWSGSFIVD